MIRKRAALYSVGAACRREIPLWPTDPGASARSSTGSAVTFIELTTGSGKSSAMLAAFGHIRGDGWQTPAATGLISETLGAVLWLTQMATASRTDSFARLRRPTPRLFAVPHLEHASLAPGSSDTQPTGHLQRRVRRVLSRLDGRYISMQAWFVAAVRLLLSDMAATAGELASVSGPYSRGPSFDIPVTARPQVTRGPTPRWTNSTLSVHGKTIRA